MNVKARVEELAVALAGLPEIDAIGVSSAPIPSKPQDGDIDLFVYCDQVPDRTARARVYPAGGEICDRTIGVFRDEHWGDADFFTLNGIETWVMYFDESRVQEEFERMIAGERTSRERGFYPSGRLAMFRNMTILYEKKPILSGYKQRLRSYPVAFGNVVMRECRATMADEEDLLRAVTRGDVLFFHAAMDEALDALMQYAFALNEVLFPSRKRNLVIADGFARQPHDFVERIERIIVLGSRAETLSASFEEFRTVKADLLALGT